MDEDVEQLVTELNCDDFLQCQVARRKLVDIGSPVVNRLIEALSSDKYWVRWEATKALGQIADRSAAEALVKKLEDKEFDVRWLAAEALINIGTSALEPLLKALADHGEKSISLRNGAHHVLHDMHKGQLYKILKPVMVILDETEPNGRVVIEAKNALNSLKKALA